MRHDVNQMQIMFDLGTDLLLTGLVSIVIVPLFSVS